MPESKDHFKIPDLMELNRNKFSSKENESSVQWKTLEGGKSYVLEMFPDHFIPHQHTASHQFQHTASLFSSVNVTNPEPESDKLAYIYKSERTGLWHFYLTSPYSLGSELKSKGADKDVTKIRLACILALIFNHKAPEPLTSYLNLSNNPTRVAVLSAVALEWGLYENSPY